MCIYMCNSLSLSLYVPHMFGVSKYPSPSHARTYTTHPTTPGTRDSLSLSLYQSRFLARSLARSLALSCTTL